MERLISRRLFVFRGSATLAGAAAAASLLAATGGPASAQAPPAVATPDSLARKKKVRGPALDPAMVKEFVGAAHGKLDRTTEMLTAVPALVNATWDWGDGDWETGLGGAAHMGNRPIAEYLLAHGARMDVFAAAMLDHVDLVAAFLAADPAIVRLAGPHGIPLLRHAEAGEAKRVIELLKKNGA